MKYKVATFATPEVRAMSRGGGWQCRSSQVEAGPGGRSTAPVRSGRANGCQVEAGLGAHGTALDGSGEAQGPMAAGWRQARRPAAPPLSGPGGPMAAEWRRGWVPTAPPLSGLGRPRGPWLPDGSGPGGPRHHPCWVLAGLGAIGCRVGAGPQPATSWEELGAEPHCKK